MNEGVLKEAVATLEREFARYVLPKDAIAASQLVVKRYSSLTNEDTTRYALKEIAALFAGAGAIAMLAQWSKLTAQEATSGLIDLLAAAYGLGWAQGQERNGLRVALEALDKGDGSGTTKG